MIAVGNEKTVKNKYRWNYCNHMPMLSLLGENDHLSLFHMAKHFIWINGENILMGLRLYV